MKRYKTRNVLYVDIDGTLMRNGELNIYLVDVITKKKAEGYYVALWSARGLEYAQNFAEKYDITLLFDAILPKPGFVADDKGWSWVKYTEYIDLFI